MKDGAHTESHDKDGQTESEHNQEQLDPLGILRVVDFHSVLPSGLAL